MLKVKICGITSERDAFNAIEIGVNALGFIFAASPRQITPEKAGDIIRSLPPFVESVGVFVNEDPEKIKALIHRCGLDRVQLHGDESPEICAALMPRSIKSFQIKDESSLSCLTSYQGKVRALLFDTYAENQRGGIGKAFDWDLAVKGKKLGVPVILSGGLNPGNVADALTRVRPFAIDVNSGVEESPGRKSLPLMRKLMEAVRKTERKLKHD
ncbi:phosphoribosylanthranilate isomerase [Thermodesulfobacteriota bacterium]